MKPYYEDEAEQKTCECGCGASVVRRFVTGHNRRGEVTPLERRAKIAASQRVAWETKRKRMPLGSRRLDANGYWLVKVREGGGRWDKEHVLIMQRLTGRPLATDEHVHHINGVKTDNHPDNLHLCTRSEHSTAHASLTLLLPELVGLGLVMFDRDAGVYRIG